MFFPPTITQAITRREKEFRANLPLFVHYVKANYAKEFALYPFVALREYHRLLSKLKKTIEADKDHPELLRKFEELRMMSESLQSRLDEEKPTVTLSIITSSKLSQDSIFLTELKAQMINFRPMVSVSEPLPGTLNSELLPGGFNNARLEEVYVEMEDELRFAAGRLIDYKRDLLEFKKDLESLGPQFNKDYADYLELRSGHGPGLRMSKTDSDLEARLLSAICVSELSIDESSETVSGKKKPGISCICQ